MLRSGSIVYWALFAAMMGFALGAAVVGTSSKPRHYAQAENTQQPSTQTTVAEPSGSARPTAASNDNTNRRGQGKSEQCEYHGPRWFAGIYCFFAAHEKFWLAVGTLILAIATTILGIATIFLSRRTRQLVEGAEQTAERQLRAYVFIKKPRIVGLFDSGGITLTCKIQNFGQTPAYEFVCAATSYVGPDPAGTVIVPGSIGPVSQLDLGPGGSITVTEKHRALSGDEIADLKKGVKAIYFSGNVAYKDAFGNGQTMTFNLMKGRRGGIDGETMAVCPIGNKAS